MENFLLNFAAQIDIAKINITPNVKRTLSALNKGTSGTSTIKQEVQLDIKSIGKVSDIGGDLVKDLQKSIAKIKISPTTILNEKELSSVTGRLEQIPIVLKAINAQMQFILAKPELVPNAAESLGRLGNLKRSLKDIRQEAEKGIKLQFSSELAPVRQLDSSILATRNRIQDLQSQLEKLKAASSKPASEAETQGKKAFDAKAKIDAIRNERRSAKKLSADEIAALKGQEQSAIKALEEAKKRRTKVIPIKVEIETLAKKEKDLTAPLFKAQSSLTEGQRISTAEIDKAKASLEAERANLQKLRAAKESLDAQASVEGPKAQKILQPKQIALTKASSEKTSAIEELEKIKTEQAKILSELRQKAEKFLSSQESPFVKAQSEFKSKTKNVKNIEERTRIKSEILGPFAEEKAQAESILKTPGFQPKDAQFQALEKKRLELSAKVEDATARQTSASNELEIAKAVLAEKDRIKSVNDAIAVSEKKVETTLANIAALEKLRASQAAAAKSIKDTEASKTKDTPKKETATETNEAVIRQKKEIESLNADILAREKELEASAARLLSIQDQRKERLAKIREDSKLATTTKSSESSKNLEQINKKLEEAKKALADQKVQLENSKKSAEISLSKEKINVEPISIEIKVKEDALAALEKEKDKILSKIKEVTDARLKIQSEARAKAESFLTDPNSPLLKAQAKFEEKTRGLSKNSPEQAAQIKKIRSETVGVFDKQKSEAEDIRAGQPVKTKEFIDLQKQEKAFPKQLLEISSKIEKAKSELEQAKKSAPKQVVKEASEPQVALIDIKVKEDALAAIRAEKAKIIAELSSIDKAQESLRAESRDKARAFLESPESPFVQAKKDFEERTKGLKKNKDQEKIARIERETIGKFTQQRLNAESTLNFSLAEPKSEEFAALKKRKEETTFKAAEIISKEKAAQQELEKAKKSSGVINQSILDSENKIAETISKINELEKQHAIILSQVQSNQISVLNNSSAVEKSESRRLRKEATDTKANIKSQQDALESLKRKRAELQIPVAQTQIPVQKETKPQVVDASAVAKVEQDLSAARKQLEEERRKLSAAKQLALEIEKSGAPDTSNNATLETKEKLRKITSEIAVAEKAVEDAEKRSLSVGKQQQDQLNKLLADYNSLKKIMDDTVEKRLKLEEKKKAGKTGLETADARVIEAEKALASVRSKLLITGEDPKQTKEFQNARNELKSAIIKRNEALAQQREIEKEILGIQGQLTAQQSLQIDLEGQQNSLVASMAGNLKQDLALRQKIEDSINRAVKAEENLQKRIGEAFAKSGKRYIQPDAREKALERLGVTEAEISASPSEQLLSKIKTKKFDASQSRTNDLAKAVANISSEERARILEEKFDVALKNLKLIQERKAKTTLASTPALDRGKIFEQERQALIENAFGKSITGLSILSGTKVSEATASLSTEDAVLRLRKIQEIIRNQTEEKRKQIQLEKDLASQEKNRVSSNAIIEDLMRKELKNRARMVSAFAEQGINFDPRTGLATRSVRAGETPPPPTRVVDPITSARETILNRLGVTEAQVSSGDSAVRAQILKRSKEIAVERERELQSAQITANRTVATDRLIINLRELIARDLEIARRNAALNGGPAPTLGASSARVLGQTLGSGVVNLTQARATFESGSEADAVATLNRVTDARRRQRQEVSALEQAEARAARAAREASRAQQQEGDRRRAGIERLNALLERSALLYERQVRTANALSRTGVPNVPSRPVDRGSIERAARRTILGGVDPNSLSAAELDNAVNLGRRRLRDQQAALREFNSTVKDVSNGSRSAFELISKYSDNAFDRFGARVGLATERLAAYVTSGAGLYTIIAQTRQAIIETALLEKEITNIQQIFDSLSGEVRFGDTVANSFDIATEKAANLKDLALELGQITGIAPIEIAQAAKTLAAAGFGGQGKPGFEETVRAVSFATLGPSFGNSQEIIDGLTAALNQFNRSLEETPYILGIVNQFSKDYAVEAQDLFEAIKRGGGSFAAVGGNLEDFLKLVTITREQTREAAPVVGTFLKTVSARLFTPKTDKLLANIGLDANTLLDPYERLLAISKKLEKSGGAAGNVSILSTLIDTRQTGRLFALLEKLRDFDEEFQKKDIAGQAARSIVEDARKRLNDIGPTIDRIRISYFKFIEGIYNNPATKAILDIPAGLIGALSEVPKLGFSIGKAQFSAANFINPLAQAGAITGLAAVIRGAIAAYRQNQLTVSANTSALDSLRQAVGRLTVQLGAAALPDAPAGAPGRGNRGGGIFSGLALPGGRTFAALAIASAVPGIVNSILPSTDFAENTQQEISSAVQGGISAALIANVLGANARLSGAIGLLAGGLAALAVASENARKEKELAKLEAQSANAILVQRFESISKAGRIERTDLGAPDKQLGNLLFAVSQLRKNEKDLSLNKRQEKIDLLQGDGKFTSQDLVDELLGLNESENKDRKKLQQQLLVDQAKRLESIGVDFDPQEAEKALNSVGEKIRIALDNLLAARMTGVEDTAQNRRSAIRAVAQEFSSKVSVSGLKFSQEEIEKSLSKYLELEKETGKFSSSLGTFKFSIKSLYEEAEIAGRIITSLGAAIAKSFETQNIGIQRVIDQAKRNLPSVETTRRITTTPFVAQNIQPLSQTASLNTIVKTIEGLSETTPINILSPEVLKLTSIIDGFLAEISSANSIVREDIIRAFSDEKLKSIGGTQQETIDTEETRAALRGVTVTNEVLGQQIESTFSSLRDLGPSSRDLFDLIRTSGPFGVQPFDLRELGKAITSGETGAGIRILGLQGAEQKLREQANLLIERQNLSIQNQIQASEALVGAIIERRNTEIELGKATRDNALNILAFKSNLGLVTKEFSSEFAQVIKNAELNARGGTQDVGGISELINAIKFAQNEVNKVIQRSGSVGGTNLTISSDLSRLIQSINQALPEFGIGSRVRINEIGSAASDLATSRALLERSIQEVFNNLQEKFRNFGEVVDSIGAKIQAQRTALDGIITKLFSGSPAERGVNEAALLSGQRNAARIVAAASAVEPKFKTKELGQSEIIASDAIARAVAPIVKTLSQRDLLSLREYLNIAGSNQLDAGSTGDQVKAAIEAAFGSFVQTFGIQARQPDIASNVQAGKVAIEEAAKVAEKLRQSGIEQANIMSGNLNLVSNEVKNLSAAIAAIPKQIDIVIKGINNVTVDFNMKDIQKSMSDVGSQVYNQVIITLTEAFRRAGIPTPDLR